MKVWIVAAVKDELRLLLDVTNARMKGRPGGFLWFCGTVGDHAVNLGVTGVGIANAAMALGVYCTTLPPDLLVMVGSAGALPGSGLRKGDTVVAEKEILAELGVLNGPGIGDAHEINPLGIKQELPLDREISSQLLAAARKGGRSICGRSLTVVGVSGDNFQARERAAHFRALIENMEGYALALAGHRFGCKAVEIRGISNDAGDRDKSRWNFEKGIVPPQKAVLEYLCATH